jgi:hypothetical protein
MLTQRFVGLFLTSKTGVLSLEHAAEVLLSACVDSSKTKSETPNLHSALMYLLSSLLSACCFFFFPLGVVSS